MSGAGAPPVVALAGNPNSGKTTLFNRLTGLRQRVGNYPGVTVEKKTGRARLGDVEATVVDLPGTYSLVSRSREEAIAFEVVAGHAAGLEPAVVVVVVDASNLRRNLYLAHQLLELGRPTVVALNMVDQAREAGIVVDAARLSELLGVAVVPVSAARGENIDALSAAIGEALARPESARPHPRPLPEPVAAAVRRIAETLPSVTGGVDPRAWAAWVLATWADAREAGTLGTDDDPFAAFGELGPSLARTAEVLELAGDDLAARMIEARYAVAEAWVERVESRRGEAGPSLTDRLDAILLHRALGPLVLFLVLAVVFQGIFAWAEPLMDGVEGGFGLAADAVRGAMPPGALRDLLADGVVAGVGSVVVFLPQIAILFGAIAVLEDTGYLARAAYIMDKVMARIGLHGRAFVPLMSGFACAIPAIMAARTIESAKDRLVTILVIPLVTCSARLPVYALIISALFSDREPVLGFLELGGLMLLGMYLLSVLVTIAVAAVLKRTLLVSPTPPLVLELPPYRLPRPGSVLRRVLERCTLFLRDAGTVILACTIVLWALLAYPKHVEPTPALAAALAAAEASGDATALETAKAGLEAERVARSYAGRLGHAIEPLITPLGYDWKIGIGLIGSFAAREVLVATLGLVYGVGEADEESAGLREAIRAQRHPTTGAPVYTPLVGFSLMIFFLLAAQCTSTLAIVRRETGGWRWPAFMFGYMTLLAWLGAFAVYQGGRLLGLG